MTDRNQNISILASMIRQLAIQDNDQHLKNKVYEAKLRSEFPSLYEFNRLVVDQSSSPSSTTTTTTPQRFTSLSPSISLIRSRLKELLLRKQNLIKKTLLTKDELQDHQCTMDSSQVFEERLQFFHQELLKADQLNKSIERQREKLARQMKDFLDTYEFMIVNYGLEYKIDFDKKSIEHLMLRAQHLLMDRRFQNTEQAHSKYGSREAIGELKRERQDLERTGKSLKSRLEELKQQLDKLQKLDPELREEYRTLMNELECKKWALSGVKKD